MAQHVHTLEHTSQINDVHYMTTPLRPGSSSHKGDDDGEDGVGLLPVHLTPFARDKAFGFRHSNLRDWVRIYLPIRRHVCI